MVKLIILFSFLIISCSPNAYKADKGYFYYNESANICQDGEGKKGLNNQLGPCADLKGKVLRGEDLSGYNLQGADFSYATLDHMNFNKAQLQGAKFYNTVILNSTFDEANLSLSFFNKAAVEDSSFKKSSLVRIQVKESGFEDSDFSQIQGEDWSLENSYLYNNLFTAAILKGSQIKGAYIKKNNFNGADLQQVLFDDSDLSGIEVEDLFNIQNPNYQGDILITAQHEANSFDFADLRNSILRNSYFSLNTFRSARLQRSLISNSNFQGADFSFSAIVLSRISEADFSSIEILSPYVYFESQSSNISFRGEKVLYQISSFNNLIGQNSEIKNSYFFLVQASLANFSSSNLAYTQFYNSTIDQASFYRAGMFQTYIEKSNLNFSSFDQANLGVEIYISSFYPGMYMNYFIDNDLSNTNFSNSLFSFINPAQNNQPSGPNMKGSIFRLATLINADFSGGSLKSANLELSNTTQSFFSNVIYNNSTILPFSLDEANSRGMIFQE